MLDAEAQIEGQTDLWDKVRKKWPGKFKEEDRFIFQEIHPGDRIFIGTGCGEPQHLVGTLLRYIQNNPKAFLDAELMNIVTLGVAPYTDEKFRYNFRLNSFFVGNNTRNAVNRASADYTPIFLSAVPELILSERNSTGRQPHQAVLFRMRRKHEPWDSVDIIKAAVVRPHW
jgi:acyl-CoA hydrolase